MKNWKEIEANRWIGKLKKIDQISSVRKYFDRLDSLEIRADLFYVDACDFFECYVFS